ncbi:DNA polymerase/3'-5' exonuclease PolX [Hydrogenimonas urashimensis]|uniref:DNA polymerase/3'-5' exonuclease PolX n=1 Tax=Hydrogenimonas urashimensis TaxID=2740515 RepID=UPI0019154456|nr:DNA polymerase/3'-5' exonuclease PolX [Hydrogenimonas urashimensis]
MALSNSEIADIFNQMADMLEIKGANPFKVRAYRNAARTVQNLGKSLEELVEEGMDLTKLPGIGHDLAESILEIIRTGKFSKLETLKKELPEGLDRLLAIEGLGPKRIRQLYDTFHITSLEQLAKVAESGAIYTLKGFGPKLVEKILKGVQLAKKSGHRFRFDVAKPFAEGLRRYLLDFDGVLKVEIAGSYRRRKETVGDLDILVVAKNWEKVTEWFVRYERLKEVVSKGPTRSTVILRNDLQVDLRSVAKESYGSALNYFTGSKAHNIKLRKMAVERGWKVNEYGIFEGEKRLGGEREEDLYELLGLCYIEPELREDRGEIEACMEGKLPKLVTPEEIRGDLHMHSKWTDGHATIEEMALAARKKGYEYIAITDHSRHLSVARGLDEKRLRQQMEEIDRLNEKLKDITILKGIECDILEDGTLDLPDAVLEELDLVIGAVHYKFNLSKKEQTRRVVKAMQHPCFSILAHPTGRIIGHRNAYELDMGEIFKACRNENVALELNAQPERLDINDIYAKSAKEEGIRVSIATDAHDTMSLDFMEYGLNQARRGWLEKEDVVNTLSLKKLKDLLA